VEERVYADEQEMFLDCVRLNTSHGLRLSHYDRTKILTVGRGLQIDESLLVDSLTDTAGATRAPGGAAHGDWL
jgi:hypothetical protein